MNERIRELAEQAAKDDKDGYPVTLEYTNRFAEKFALLIIAECLLALEPNSMAPDIDYKVEEKIYERCAKKIQGHFKL